MHFLREPLDCERLELTVLKCGPGWTWIEHDYADDCEEVYLLLEGRATVTAAGEDLWLEPGEALRVPPEATRQIQNGDIENTLVLTGAP